MIEWLILYADESTFSNLDGLPYEAPREGVMETFFADERTGVSVESSPIGRWGWKADSDGLNGRWFGFDDHHGFLDYLAHYPGPVIPLFGRTLHDHEWEGRIRDFAKELMRSDKSAWRSRERRA